MKSIFALFLGAILVTNINAAAADPTLHYELVRLTTDIAAGADRHEWDRVRSAMTDEVTTDYTRLFGDEPVTQPADELVKGWANFLPGFETTQHMITNQAVKSVEGDRASAESDVLVTHRIGENFWVLGARYSYELRKVDSNWLVSSMSITPLWETGDRGLVQQAAERSAAE